MSRQSTAPPLDVAARREHLLLRSAQLREQLTTRSTVLRPAFSAADRVRGGVASVRDNRAILLLGGAALAGAVLVRPRMMVNLGLRAWSGWQVFQRVRPLVNSVLRQL